MSTASTDTTEASEVGWLCGRVVDLAGRPLSGATISWVGISTSGRETVTAAGAADGTFRIGPLPGGPAHVLWVEAPGHARLRIGEHESPEVAVHPGDTHDLGDVALAAEAALTGRIVDANGRALAGVALKVELHYHQLAHTITANGPPLEVVTATDGGFRFGSLPPGPVTLEIAAPGHPKRRRWERLVPGVLELGELRVVPESSRIEGVVTDGEGIPRAGLRVYADGDDETCAWTDAAGRFVLVARSAKPRGVTVVDEDGHQTSTRMSDPAAVRVELDSPRYLDCRVVDAQTGRPVAVEDLDVCEVVRRGVDGEAHYLG